MASYNKVIIVGNLTRDPEVRYTPKGSAVCDLSLALNRSYTSEGEEKKEEVTYVDCTAWAKTAELIGQYLKKGSGALIEGRLNMESWEDKQTGQKRSKLKVIVENVQFLGGKNDGGDEGRQGGQATQRPPSGGADYRRGPSSQQQPPPSQQGGGGGDMEDQDIPFSKPHYMEVGGW